MSIELSVVTTLYKSRDYIPELVATLKNTISKMPIQTWEIVMVNDGSPDDSLDVALKVKRENPDIPITIIDLSRNFGHHTAILAGIEHARGNLVFVTDSDMEEDPTLLPHFYETMMGYGADAVFGYIPERKGNIWERISHLFWKFFIYVSGLNMPHNVRIQRLMNRRYADALVNMGDYAVFISGMYHWVGFKQIGIPMTRHKRRQSSTYNLRRKLYLAIDAITSFSAYPLRILFYAGIFIMMVCMAFVAYRIVLKLLHPGEFLPGYTSIIVSIFFSTGLIMFSMGVVGF